MKGTIKNYFQYISGKEMHYSSYESKTVSFSIKELRIMKHKKEYLIAGIPFCEWYLQYHFPKNDFFLGRCGTSPIDLANCSKRDFCSSDSLFGT